MTEPLLPCPFCGTPDPDLHVGWIEGNPDQTTIRCRECQVVVWCGGSEEWNRRDTADREAFSARLLGWNLPS